MLNESLFTFDQVKKSKELGGRHFNWVHWDQVKRNALLYGNREALADTFWGTAPEQMRRKTWNQVYYDTNTIISNLLKTGLRKGGIVLTHLPNCIESAYLDYATSKLGCMHCGLNVDLGKAETLGVLQKIKPDVAVIVTSWHGRDFLEWYREGLKQIPGMKIFVLTNPNENVPDDFFTFSSLLDSAIWEDYTLPYLDSLRTDPLDVHELLPTAGTTGVPKISRRTTVDWFHVHSVCIAERSGQTVYDSRLLIGPLSGGSGRLWGVHTSLYTGGRSIYLTEFNEEDIFKISETEKVTIWTWNPALITRIVSSSSFDQCDLSTLRLVLYSGAPMSAEIIEKLVGRGITPYNVYGTSEVGGCMGPILPGISRDHLLTAAGVPFEGYDVPVVDMQGNRLPPGTVGEILIWNIHHGYFNSPADSRTTYNDEEYGGKWDGYQHTGDLGFYDEEGYLRVVGRKKDMILRGSQNIFPKEVEDILSQHPKVRDIAITAMPDKVLGEKACAYVVPMEGEKPTLEDFIVFLDEKGVAKFKWPERVELIDEMPLGPGGKILKGTLRQMIADKLKDAESGKG